MIQVSYKVVPKFRRIFLDVDQLVHLSQCIRTPVKVTRLMPKAADVTNTDTAHAGTIALMVTKTIVISGIKKVIRGEARKKAEGIERKTALNHKTDIIVQVDIDIIVRIRKTGTILKNLGSELIVVGVMMMMIMMASGSIDIGMTTNEETASTVMKREVINLMMVTT